MDVGSGLVVSGSMFGVPNLQYEEETKRIVERFLELIRGLSWKNPTIDAKGTLSFACLTGAHYALSAAAATAGGSKTLEVLQRGTTPFLARKEGAPYERGSDADDSLAWSKIHKDPRILAEVDRLVKEARGAKKSHKRTRMDVRRDQVYKQLRKLHEANMASGITSDQSVDLIKDAIDLLVVELVTTS